MRSLAAMMQPSVTIVRAGSQRYRLGRKHVHTTNPLVTVPAAWLAGASSVPGSVRAWESFSVYMDGIPVIGLSVSSDAQRSAPVRVVASQCGSVQHHERRQLRCCVLQRDGLVEPRL